MFWFSLISCSLLFHAFYLHRGNRRWWLIHKGLLAACITELKKEVNFCLEARWLGKAIRVIRSIVFFWVDVFFTALTCLSILRLKSRNYPICLSQLSKTESITARIYSFFEILQVYHHFFPTKKWHCLWNITLKHGTGTGLISSMDFENILFPYKKWSSCSWIAGLSYLIKDNLFSKVTFLTWLWL